MDQDPKSLAPHIHGGTAPHHDHPHEEQKPHAHPHDEEHGHDHGHSHDGSHDHAHGNGLWGWINTIFHLHGHSEQQQQRAADTALADSAEGIRTVWLALVALGITTIMQIGIVYISGSVALLADTVHNLGDTLNSIPLLIAFYLARRVATRRYTYGFGKAEDVAGIFIVISIAVSAGVGLWESFAKLIHPAPMTNLGWVATAAVIGFAGNEAVALLQIRVGRKIGSAAMVADGLHARTDGLTSLAVLIAVIGTYLGFPIVDPIIGLLIGVAILFITRDAMVTMWYRLMDAIDPATVDQVEQIAQAVTGVIAVHDTRVRWLGHRLQAELHIVVNEDLHTSDSYAIAEEVRHVMFHELPHLSLADVNVEPCGHGGKKMQVTAHHQPITSTTQPQSA